MKIGDKVRFLSETGGGKVIGFQKNNIVLVEDEDGFQIPFPKNEVVVISSEDYSSTKFTMPTIKSKNGESEIELNQDNRSIKSKMKEGQDDMSFSFDDEFRFDKIDDEKEITFKTPTEERQGGDLLNTYLAFVPTNIKQFTSSAFEVYFVNDCNYYIQYSYLVAEGNTWTLQYQGEVAPNTKILLGEFGRDVLNDLSQIAIQLFAYKRDKSFVLKPSIDVKFRLDPVKFYKLHSFSDNDFFDTQALLYPIVEHDIPIKPLIVDSKKIENEMFSSVNQWQSKNTNHRSSQNLGHDLKKKEGVFMHHKYHNNEDISVIDLHAESLLDSISGMSSLDILNYQLKIFRETIDCFKGKKGKKIIFIHGKGEGVLRNAIVNELHYRYKKYSYQDASFQEYGYGATQVTIK